MQVQEVIPILRIFDADKAREFYIEWLGFKLDWDHVFESGMPIYMQVSREGISLHLSEHHGDCSPGARVYITCTGLKDFHQQLIGKKYKYNKPGIEKTFHNTWCMEVIDPFGNRLTFNENII